MDLQLEKLRAEARNLRPPTSYLLISSLKYVKHCLEINQEDRPSSEALAKRYQSLYEMISLAREDDSYPEEPEVDSGLRRWKSVVTSYTTLSLAGITIR